MLSRIYKNPDGTPYEYTDAEIIRKSRKDVASKKEGSWGMKGLLEIIDARQLDEIRRLGT